jgi:hypothetical protein
MSGAVDTGEYSKMISAFDVYLVMQLDSIKAALGMLSFASLASVILAVIFLADTNDEDLAKTAIYYGKRIVVAAVAFALLCCATPSSKTAAAMIILPAVTSEQVTTVLSAEGQELYGIAKEALKGLLEKDVKVEKGNDK